MSDLTADPWAAAASRYVARAADDGRARASRGRCVDDHVAPFWPIVG